MEIAIGIVACGVILSSIVIFVLFYLGIVSSYHPMKKPKDEQVRVACVGDSITYGFFVANWRKNNYPAVLNRLLGDSYCVNSFAYTNRTAIKSGDYPLVNEKVYRQSLDFEPNIVIILLGTNDSKASNWDENNFVADYCEMIDGYLKLKSAPKVYVLLPPPAFEVRKKVLYQIRKSVLSDEVVPAIERISVEMGVNCIDVRTAFDNRGDLFVDGVHPNVKGSELLAKTVFEALINDSTKQ